MYIKLSVVSVKYNFKVKWCFPAYSLLNQSTGKCPSRHDPDFHLPQSQIKIVGPDFHPLRSQKCLLGYDNLALKLFFGLRIPSRYHHLHVTD